MNPQQPGPNENGGARPAVKHTRKRASKSRQGCARCKSRRIRCDEKRPDCGNCQKLGSPCPGYLKELRWSTKHEMPQQNLKRASHEPESPPDPQSIVAATSDSQQHYEQQYTHQSPIRWGSPASQDSLSIREGISGISEIHIPDHFRQGGADISRPVVHIPTKLVEHWFSHICPRRSTFDSHVNFNRLLAHGTWDTSEAVFYTLQAVSAVCLSGSVSQFGQTPSSLRDQAIAAINQSVHHARTSSYPRVTADLVFAVFVWGTSLFWIAAGNVESTWLGLARELLDIWQKEVTSLDSLFYGHFRQALTYWEMLAAAAGRDSGHPKLAQRRRKHEQKLQPLVPGLTITLPDPDDNMYPTSDLGRAVLGTRPNSWCGISNEVIDVFGQVLALCRSARRRNRYRGAFTIADINSSLCDISLAQQLQGELLSLDFDHIVRMEEVQGFPVHTGDANTPISDLLKTAEAYRQAALLHLYLTFGDLPLKTGADRRDEFIQETALKLLKTLKEIPLQSGSKSIHTMLYLSAAVGLGGKSPDDVESDREGSIERDRGHDPWSGFDLHGVPSRQGSDTSRDEQPAMVTWSGVDQHSEQSSLPAFSPESNGPLSRARQTVVERLQSLERTLPQVTGTSVLELVTAVWAAYDAPQPERSSVHWVDVLDQMEYVMLW